MKALIHKTLEGMYTRLSFYTATIQDLEKKQKILIEALKRECSCPHTSSYVTGEEIICDAHEALRKVGIK